MLYVVPKHSFRGPRNVLAAAQIALGSGCFWKIGTDAFRNNTVLYSKYRDAQRHTRDATMISDESDDRLFNAYCS